MIGWLRHQKHALTRALRRLLAQPIATLLTTLAWGWRSACRAGCT